MPALWRVFPWDERATPGDRFSPSHVPRASGRGRFDLPVDRSRVLYLAETAEHALAELLQPWRGRPLRSAHLEHAGRPLALVEVHVDDDTAAELLDLCDPDVIARERIAPDIVASRHRHFTQPLAAAAWEREYGGLRWWSTFWGDWHTVVLFEGRLRSPLRFATPVALSTDHPVAESTAAFLGML
jgi:hypothetical protein